MKKILVALAALVWAGGAFAGDYHRLSTLRCSDCHTMHASRSHDLNGPLADPNFPAPFMGPFAKLLIADGVNSLCLTCHDAKASAPDVMGANSGIQTGTIRSAGALNGQDSVGGHIVTGEGYQDWMGHTLNSPDAPPGWTVGPFDTGLEGFNCSNCHAVHGSPAYRNLGLSQYVGLPAQIGSLSNPMYTAGPTYNAQDLTTGVRASTTFDFTKDVTIGVQPRDYATANVAFGIGSLNATAPGSPGGATPWKVNGMNEFCATCHGDFHGTTNTVGFDVASFKRHPTGILSARADGSSLLVTTADLPPLGPAQTNVVRPAWTSAVGAGFQAACLTCHKGHGNQRGYGLLYPSNVGGLAGVSNFEEGDAAALAGGVYPIRNLCITCHAQGRN